MTQAQLIAASLGHRKLRTLLLAFSIGMSTLVVTLTSAAVRRISAASEDFRTPAVLVMGVSNALLPLRYVDQIRKLPGVVGAIDYYRSFPLKTPEGFVFQFWTASDGWADGYPKSQLSVPPEAMAAWRADRQGLIATDQVLRAMGWKVGQLVTLPADPQGIVVEGRVVGVAWSETATVMIHYEQYTQLKGSSTVRRMIVRCDPSACANLPATIDATFENSSDAPTETVPDKDFFELIMASAQAVPDLLIRIGILLVLVTIVVTMSTINTSLTERSSEIGALRVLGFSRLRTLAILTSEAIVLAISAGFVGACLPLIVFHSHGLPMGGGQVTVRIALGDSALAFVVACAVGVIVGLPPAFLAVRRDVLRLLAG